MLERERERERRMCEREREGGLRLQCDQITVHSLAVYVNLPSSITIAKVGAKGCQIPNENNT